MPVKKIVTTDSPELLTVLDTSFFRREGFTVFSARSSDTVYRLVEAEAPDLAIIDLDVLGAEGVACCRRIKQDPLLRGTPLVVVLPGAGGAELAGACRQSGCEVLQPRPLEEGQLLDAACALLGVDRRLARRFPVELPVIYAATGGKPQTGRVINLHADGMFVTGGKLFPVGTGLRLELSLPGMTGTLVCLGRVAWVNHPEWLKKTSLPDGMGVRLLLPPGEILTALRAYVDTLAR